jgi:4'-phosphopantetheinyl transferase
MPEPTAHVWLVNLAGPEQVTARALATLPVGETRRLSTTLPAQRPHRIRAQAALRTLAAAFVGSTPLMLRIERGDDGKPRLGEPGGGTHLSLAHGGRFAAVALCTAGSIGVDVEPPRATSAPAGLARTMLSASEYERWRTLAEPAGAAHALFRSWTYKEAVLKALGIGLAGDVRAVSTRPDPHGRPELESLPPAAGRASDWTLHDLYDLCGLPAAVAVAAPGVRLRFHRALIGELL